MLLRELLLQNFQKQQTLSKNISLSWFIFDFRTDSEQKSIFGLGAFKSHSHEEYEHISKDQIEKVLTFLYNTYIDISSYLKKINSLGDFWLTAKVRITLIIYFSFIWLSIPLLLFLDGVTIVACYGQDLILYSYGDRFMSLRNQKLIKLVVKRKMHSRMF